MGRLDVGLGLHNLALAEDIDDVLQGDILAAEAFDPAGFGVCLWRRRGPANKCLPCRFSCLSCLEARRNERR